MSIGRAERLGLEVRDGCGMPMGEWTLPGFKALLRTELHPREALVLPRAGASPSPAEANPRCLLCHPLMA